MNDHMSVWTTPNIANINSGGKTMIKCKKIQKNSTVGVYSPSEPITDNRRPRLEDGIKPLENNGFSVKYSKNAFNNYYYMAGTPEERALDINNLVKDDEVDFLLASWGGKSCNQILQLLDYDSIKNARKPILGFSDGCVLINAITAKTGLFTIHGPNVAGKLHETKHSDFQILRQAEYTQNILGDTQSVSGSKVINGGKSQGRLMGGNLSTFVLGLLGSEYLPRFEKGIFFWESAGETPQIIDQYLTALINAGFFQQVTGMVIGDFIRDETESYKERDPFDVIKELFKDYSFPIIHTPTFGHPGHLENPAIPIGPMCELDSDNATLSLLENIIE